MMPGWGVEPIGGIAEMSLGGGKEEVREDVVGIGGRTNVWK